MWFYYSFKNFLTDCILLFSYFSFLLVIFLSLVYVIIKKAFRLLTLKRLGAIWHPPPHPPPPPCSLWFFRKCVFQREVDFLYFLIVLFCFLNLAFYLYFFSSLIYVIIKKSFSTVNPKKAWGNLTSQLFDTLGWENVLCNGF